MIRLKKTNPMPRNRDRRYITDYEVAIWLTRGKWIFNRQNEKYERPEFEC
jgi:site-specific DNA-methyltransferase (adenine-specific)